MKAFSSKFTFSLSKCVFTTLSKMFARVANTPSCHCMKSVQIQSYFWFVFSRIRTEYLLLNLRIQSQYRKIWTRNNSLFGHFPRSVCDQLNTLYCWIHFCFIRAILTKCEPNSSPSFKNKLRTIQNWIPYIN